MSLNRRQFLRTSAVIGGGLIIGFELAGCGEKSLAPAIAGNSLQVNSFLEITPGGEIILQLNRVEMGQGVYTSLTTLVAEELEVDPAQITLRQAPSHPDFADSTNKIQLTGGSNSLKNSFLPLRQVGANAKFALLAA
ncbi:MAG: molybdopterin cofactor-binding domain-containing protein, partial [Spongiibacteraceae bacterium]